MRIEIDEKDAYLKREIESAYDLIELDVLELLKKVCFPGSYLYQEYHNSKMVNYADYYKNIPEDIIFQIQEDNYLVDNREMIYMMLFTSLYLFFPGLSEDNLQICYNNQSKLYGFLFDPIMLDSISAKISNMRLMPLYMRMIQHYFLDDNKKLKNTAIVMTKNKYGLNARSSKIGNYYYVAIDFRMYFLLNIISRRVISSGSEFMADDCFDQGNILLALYMHNKISARLLRQFDFFTTECDVRRVFQMTEDQMYFLVGHEFGHIMLGHFDNNNDSQENRENEADIYSFNYLMHTESYKDENLKNSCIESIRAMFYMLDYLEKIYDKICCACSWDKIENKSVHGTNSERLNGIEHQYCKLGLRQFNIVSVLLKNTIKSSIIRINDLSNDKIEQMVNTFIKISEEIR